MSTFWRSFAGFRAVHDRAKAYAAEVGLAEELDRTVRHLNYGSQRQLEVGLALACEPNVLLLDEPTSGMSPQETRRMHDLISSLPRTITVIVIEHDMDIVLSFADSLIVLDYGRVLEQGTPDADPRIRHGPRTLPWRRPESAQRKRRCLNDRSAPVG